LRQAWSMRTPTPCVLPTQPATRELLAATGMTARMIRTHVASGMLTRVRQGVFVATSAVPSGAPGRHVLAAHAEQVVHPQAVLSHESAAVVWDLPHPGFERWHESPPSVTIAATGARSRRGQAVHHRGTLPPGQVTRDHDGYAVTTVARTAVDLAAGLDLPQALVLCDAGMRQVIDAMLTRPKRSDYASTRFVSAARERLEEAATSNGRAALTEALRLAVPARESAPESLTAGHLHMAGLPMPLFQHKIPSRIGSLYPDFYWPELGLIGECDGAVKYAEALGYVNEKEREQVLRDLGYLIVRWLAKEIMVTPHIVVERIARALGL
jgi:very-short-patch-repair endonuclease